MKPRDLNFQIEDALRSCLLEITHEQLEKLKTVMKAREEAAWLDGAATIIQVIEEAPHITVEEDWTEFNYPHQKTQRPSVLFEAYSVLDTGRTYEELTVEQKETLKNDFLESVKNNPSAYEYSFLKPLLTQESQPNEEE